MLRTRFLLTRRPLLRLHTQYLSTGSTLYQNKEPEIQADEKTTQVNIREQRSDIIEGSKIDYYLKKKQTGLTDDESTIKGKVVAKTKDFTSLAFVGVALLGLGYAFYTVYTEYIKWSDKDYAFDIASKLCENNSTLENRLGVNYEISKNGSGKAGGRNFGDSVQATEVFKPEDIGNGTLECIQVTFFANTKSRKSIIQAIMVKEEGESPESYFPLYINAVVDYDKKYYAKNVTLYDYRKQLIEGTTLEILRQAQQNIEETKRVKLETGKEDSIGEISLFGNADGKASSSSTRNFASSENNTTNIEEETQTQQRRRPKF